MQKKRIHSGIYNVLYICKDIAKKRHIHFIDWENKTPHEEPNHPKHGVIMDMKNILAILAVICFTGSIFIDDRQFLLKAVAYGVGALAYLGELMAMTHMFKKRVDGRELLMPILFGVMYIMLGFSYAIEHYHLFG